MDMKGQNRSYGTACFSVHYSDIRSFWKDKDEILKQKSSTYNTNCTEICYLCILG